MNSKERINAAMRFQIPDRIPVMCQLSIGHYFLNSGLDPFDIWFSSDGFAEALLILRKEYNFDGILINLPGRDPAIKSFIKNIERTEHDIKVIFNDDSYSLIPMNDNPHYYLPDGSRYFPSFDEIVPEKLYYVDPWDITGISYPFKWGFETKERSFENFFPEYQHDVIKKVLKNAGGQFSVHSEIFSPWSQFLELLDYQNALMAIMIDPAKVKACLERLTLGSIDLAKQQAALGVDAILISSAFAGAGLISKDHYKDFVLPYEEKIISEIKKEFKLPVYTHTCGSIGDRLDLMLETGTNGIDTLDPPPLGTVELQDAKNILSTKAFIKGNIDPVNTLLYGTKDQVRNDVEWRVKVGKPNGGYILSSACSIAPKTPPENIKILAELAEEIGRY